MYVYVMLLTSSRCTGPRPYSLFLFESFQGILYEPSTKKAEYVCKMLRPAGLVLEGACHEGGI